MDETGRHRELSDRAQSLLKTLVEQYIDGGQPIGSNTLLEHSGMSASSATVRNVMSRLEKLGFIRAPHTSAGRVPTALGYRCFVDTLLKVQPLTEAEIQKLRADFEGGSKGATSSKELIRGASHLLSSLTKLAGIVTLPQQGHVELRRIEFVPLAARKVLAILVFSNQQIENRIIDLERDYTESELRQASNFLNQRFTGSDIAKVRKSILAELDKTRGDMNKIMTDAVVLAQSAFDTESEREEMVVSGETRLMEYDDLSDMERLKALFEAFSEQRDILNLLDKSLSAQGVKIFIGEESGYDLLEACSVVTAPYSNEDGVVGVLAVIGPTRMAYERVIPIVDVTAKLLGSALKSKH